MLNIAIVEDSLPDVEQINAHINQWGKKEFEEVEVATYNDARSFLGFFNGQFDIIFLDIMLPDKNGLDVAKSIRKKDETVVIVFTTNMKQYAINGYEVNALDFILKPVNYNRLALLLKKCIARIRQTSKNIVLRVPGNVYNIDVDYIVFVESRGHSVIYHMKCGQTIKKRMTLREAEQQLPAMQFSRCSVSYLINLKYVRCIEGEDVIVDDKKIKLTRSKSREFRKSFVEYYSK